MARQRFVATSVVDLFFVGFCVELVCFLYLFVVCVLFVCFCVVFV